MLIYFTLHYSRPFLCSLGKKISLWIPCSSSNCLRASIVQGTFSPYFVVLPQPVQAWWHEESVHQDTSVTEMFSSYVQWSPNSVSFLFQDVGSYIMVIAAVFSDFLKHFIELYLGLNIWETSLSCRSGRSLADTVTRYYRILNTHEQGNSLVSFLM